MDSQEESTVSPRGSPRNQKCGLNPNDPEDVRNFGELLVDITTTKADYVLPFPITSLIIFTCYQVMDDLQKDEFFRKDINKIYCLIGFITNGVSNFVKSRPDIKDSIDQMSEKELEDGIYPQILEMLQSPMVEGKSGGKRKGKKTQKRRKRGGMLPRMGRMGATIMRPVGSAIGATVRSTLRLARKINDWLPEIITLIWVLWNLFWFLHYVRLIRVKTGSALTPNDPVFTEFVKNITLGVKSGDYPILDPNVTSALVPVGDISREMQIYAPGGTRVEEFIKNAKFLSGFLLGQILRRQYSFGNTLVSSVQSVETQISVPGPKEMSEKLFKVVIRGIADDCFSDVPRKMIIDESDLIHQIMLEYAPSIAPYSQQFIDSIKAALPADIEVSAERSIQGPPKLPGLTATDLSNLEEEGDLEDEDEDEDEDEVVEEEIVASSELKPKENTGGISGFFNGIIDSVWTSETGKKASDVITVMERQSVLYSNPEIRGQCMLESAESMRKTIELEAQLLVVNLGRLKTKFKTIWSMEKENAAKAIYHFWKIVGALTFYTGIKTMTRRAAPPAAAAPAPDDDDNGDMDANALVPTGRGAETRSFGTQIASFADTGTSPMNNSNSDSNSNSYSSSSSLVSSSNPSGSGSNASSAANPSKNRGRKSPIKTALQRQAAIEEQRKIDEEQRKIDAAHGLLELSGRKVGGTRRRTSQTKKRRRPIRRRQTRKLRRNTKRRRM